MRVSEGMQGYVGPEALGEKREKREGKHSWYQCIDAAEIRMETGSNNQYGKIHISLTTPATSITLKCLFHVGTFVFAWACVL